jgi:hypothetical protein
VAAALVGGADIIVTDNLPHFPAASLPAPLAAQSLDEFLLDSLDLHPGEVESAVRAVASRTGRFGPALTVLDIATYLRAHGTPAFGDRLLAQLSQSGPAEAPKSRPRELTPPVARHALLEQRRHESEAIAVAGLPRCGWVWVIPPLPRTSTLGRTC